MWLEKRGHLVKPIHRFILSRLMDEGVESIYQVNLDNWKEAGGMEPHYLYFSQMRDSFYVVRTDNKWIDIPRINS